MVSTLLCSWSTTEDWGNISNRSEGRSNSEIFSTSEDIYDVDKPVVITSKHIAIPEILQESKDSEDILTKLLGPTCKDSNYDDNSDEIFNSHKKKNIKADLNRRNIVDKVFEKYDDPYAKFITKTPKTPGTRTPKQTLVSPTKTPASKPWKYVTVEEREARRRAAIEGQMDFCQALIKNGIDPDDYVPSVFKSVKKPGSSKKFNFECSTPKTDTFSECPTTPFTDRSNVNTPVSGIKKLPHFSAEKNYTPNYSLMSHHSDISLNETYSPVHDLPPETKSTLLSGIVCYVDVRTANEDMTASVQQELLTLGARVEKNFTKKVTHVVFKEGRVSTYLKAKKEGIPLVSVIWIEACKRVRGLADPAQHPPRKMEKYESILPFQTLKKRRLKFFNPNSKIRKNILENYHDPTFIPTLNGKKLALMKAATVCKDKVTTSNEDKENKGIRKYCTKKLQFDKAEELYPEEDNQIKDIGKDDSSIDSMPDVKKAVLRRKSAPAKIHLKKAKRKIEAVQDEDVILISDDKDKNILTGNFEMQDKKTDSHEELQNLAEGEMVDNTCPAPAPAKKKKKLYDPEEVYVSIDEGQVTQESIVKTPVKRPRTKATTSRQLVKLAVARKRANNKITTDPDDDDYGSSPSTFVDDKASDSHRNMKHKERRSIVFTSVHRSELPKYVEKVKELGRCVVENEVTKKTTHVVCNGPRRTLNLIKGIARGCWILDIKWLEDSVKEEKWLPEEKYILSNEFPCITECSRERRGLRTSHVVDIFKDLGSIYVSKAANPPKKDLDQLLKICCATISRSSSTADITVGGSKPNPNPDGIWVSEKWIIDSITLNSLQPYKSYTMTVDNKAKETALSQE